jgi:drug/metabolite transporter (DMT)-like permease
MQYLTPAFTIILAVILLHEEITYLKISGIFIICIGIVISATQFKLKFLRKLGIKRLGLLLRPRFFLKIFNKSIKI